jgi:stage III sporulation protein AG
MDFKKWLEKLKKIDGDKNALSKKVMPNLLIVLLAGVLIVMMMSSYKATNLPSVQTLNPNGASNKGDSKADGNTAATTSADKVSGDYETVVQDKLKETLEKIDGVGKVDVMVSFESGEEQVPAVNINDSTSTTEEKDTQGGTRNTTQKNDGSTVVITNQGDKSEPLIVKTYKPKVSGVCVVAEGAENKVTELRISKAVINLFNITENKVNVYPMKK